MFSWPENVSFPTLGSAWDRSSLREVQVYLSSLYLLSTYHLSIYHSISISIYLLYLYLFVCNLSYLFLYVSICTFICIYLYVFSLALISKIFIQKYRYRYDGRYIWPGGDWELRDQFLVDDHSQTHLPLRKISLLQGGVWELGRGRCFVSAHPLALTRHITSFKSTNEHR